MSAIAGTDDTIALPAPTQSKRRSSIPIVASFVPVVGAVAMWLVTGYVMMLCFAAIGPLMALASIVDSARGRRKERKQAAAELAEACRAGREQLRGRHAGEREAFERDRPDAARLAQARTLWRHGPSRLVLGRGRVPSAVRVTGGEGEESDALRRDASWVPGAPIEVALADAGGVCIQGERAVASAVARGLLIQLCQRASPEQLAVTALLPGDEAELVALPHLVAASRAVDAGASGPGTADPVRVRVAAPDGDASAPTGGFLIAVTPRGAAVPPACGVVLELEPDAGPVARRIDGAAPGEAGERIEVEAISLAQAARICAGLARRAAPGASGALPVVGLAEVLAEQARGADGEATPAGTLAVPIGRGHDGPTSVDLVHDGPHAVVVGITGSGKSELLCSWVTSLASRLGPDRVTFLLADFKGGTAFTPLVGLPHVTGMITDLDGAGSRRAVESLRAELRRREAEIAALGAADIADPRVSMPRLVIVVDEFAALLQDHGDLAQVFTDVAARGRALGMHLVLGTQRAAGVLREALLANCPLRIALRAADAADSRAVVGVDDAAKLGGDAASRGIALVRRAGDIAPERTRIARADEGTIRVARESAERAPAGAIVRSPWLPPLPREVSLDELRARPDAASGPGDVLLGLADEPERQRQPVVRLVPGLDRGLAVIGGPGSGKSTAIRLAALQSRDVLWVPAEPEAAWDAVEAATSHPPGTLVIDDLDGLLGVFPPDYAQALGSAVEALVRGAGEHGGAVVVSAARMGGQVERIAGALPVRALLRLASRADHLQAGGEGAHFDPSRPPGRAMIGGRELQFAMPGEHDAASDAPSTRRGRRSAATETWSPQGRAALVTTAPGARAARLAESWGRGVRVVAVDGVEPGSRLDDLADGTDRFVAVGDGETWLRHGPLLRAIRGSGELLVAAECPHELRTLAGERSLPPYARARANRAWRATSDGPVRVVLPA